MRTSRIAAALLAASFSCACSLALDLDSLSEGSVDTDTLPECAEDGDCDDGIDCTVDTCREDATCLSLADNDLCDYLEMCSLTEGCVSTGDECKTDGDCDDGIDCTVDICVYGTVNECENAPDHSYCDSGDPCLEGETCNTIVGCMEGTEVDCSQSGAPCMLTQCDSSDGECKDVAIPGADDDLDTYLDVSCGGDDCDDEDEDVNPGRSELCNNVDDDCDGYTDIAVTGAPSVLASAASVLDPSISFDGTTYLLAWRQNDGTGDTVVARFVAPDSSAVSGAYDFTGAPGTGFSGANPRSAAADGEFYLAWLATPGAGDDALYVMPLSVNTSTGSVTPGAPTALDVTSGAQPGSPIIAWDDDGAGGSGWVTSWLEDDGTTRTVRLQTEDMHSMTAGTTFQAASESGQAAGLDLLVLGPNDYALAYAAEESTSANSLEVRHTEITLSSSSVWQNVSGFPALVSPVNPAGADDSFQPTLAPDESGGWILGYTDTTASTSDQDILAWSGTTTTLAGGTSYHQIQPNLAETTSGFGLLYLATLGTSKALQLLQLDDALSPPAAPYTGTRFDLVSGTEDISIGDLIPDGTGGFAATWVLTDASGDHLYFAAFDGCGPVTK